MTSTRSTKTRPGNEGLFFQKSSKEHHEIIGPAFSVEFPLLEPSRSRWLSGAFGFTFDSPFHSAPCDPKRKPSSAQSAFPSTRFPIAFFRDILLRSNGANPSDLLGRKVLL